MKKLIATILAAASLLLASVTTAADKTETLLVLGDSIATGYGLKDYVWGDNFSAPSSFPNMLARDFAAYDNLAVNGRTSALLLGSLSDKTVQEKISSADKIIISTGGNDFFLPVLDMLSKLEGGDRNKIAAAMFLGKIDLDDLAQKAIDVASGVDINEIIDNIEKTLAAIKKLNPACSVTLLTVYNPMSGSPITKRVDEYTDKKFREMNQKIKSAAKKYGAKTADIYSVFKGNESKYTSIARLDVHPNEAGHKAIYDKLYSTIFSGGKYTAKDALALLRRIISRSTTPDDDINGDGKITPADALAILKKATQ